MLAVDDRVGSAIGGRAETKTRLPDIGEKKTEPSNA